MIVIQVQLSNLSLVSLFAAVVAIVPAVLGYVLGTADYRKLGILQAPACLLASIEICVALGQIAGVFWPYQLIQVGANCIISLVLLASGIYFLCVRVAHDVAPLVYSFRTSLERAFICLWLVSFVLSLAVNFFSLGAAIIATFEPEECMGKETAEEETACDSNSEHFLRKVFQKKHSLAESYPSLGTPVDIPIVATAPGTHVPMSPQHSWPSTVGTLRTSESLRSLNSALNVRDVTPPPLNLRGKGIDLPEPKTPVMKPPRSPLRMHLSKSSFSLTRSPSKSGQVKRKRSSKRLSPRASQATLRTLEPVPAPHATLPVGFPLMHEPGTQKNWVMVPNENPAESRSVSGSSQITGHVFPAAEYNRRINAAGFERDEPHPVQVQLMPSRETLSKYDLERIHRERRHS